MISVVIDTNILVSALLSPFGSPAKILDHVLNGNAVMCYDSRILIEYEEVLVRPKFMFDKNSVRKLLDFIVYTGVSIIPVPLPYSFVAEDDKMFYEVAKSANAYLVTGNAKHFPNDPLVISPQEFVSLI
jgi:putative PIN family toxin of toxin-antitoxin system